MRLQTPQSKLLKTAFQEMMKGVSTSAPGHILAFNPTTQLAQVQIGIVRVDVSGAEFSPPPIIEVPVYFPGDDFAVEYQIDPGCEGDILFSQRCIDGWLNTGGIAANPIGRFHDMQDAFFLPGFRSLPNVLPGFQNNGIRLRNRAGTQYAWLKNDGSIDVRNGAGYITIASSGVVTINGVTFDTSGNVTSPAVIHSPTMTATSMTADNVTGTVNVSFAGKSAKDHIHSGVTVGAGNTGKVV